MSGTIGRRHRIASGPLLALGFLLTGCADQPGPLLVSALLSASVPKAVEALVEGEDAAPDGGNGFAACRQEAFALDAKARDSGNAGQYAASARIAERCLAAAPTDPDRTLDVMQVMALAIQNHAKAGDAVRARELLEDYARRFPERDLYFEDGTAFAPTMAMALGQGDLEDAAATSVANVNPALKTERRRTAYWLAH